MPSVITFCFGFLSFMKLQWLHSSSEIKSVHCFVHPCVPGAANGNYQDVGGKGRAEIWPKVEVYGGVCSCWKREGFRKTLEHLPVLQENWGENLQGLGVTEQGMASN